MSLDLCLPDLIASGKLDAERGRRLSDIYEDIRARLARDHDPDTAAAMASEQALAAFDADSKRKRLNTLRQVRAQQRAWDDLRRYRGGNGDGPVNPDGALALIARDDYTPFADADGLRQAIKARAHARLDRMLAEHRRRITGAPRNRAQEADIARAAFGEQVDNVNAREIAEAVGETLEELRQSFNAAGGHIGKLDRYGLPQSHDADAVAAVPFAQWRDDLLPLLDRERMIDLDTNAPFSDKKLELVLRRVYDGIRTEGADRMEPGAPGRSMLANRRAEQRFLHFRDADAWLTYNERYGAAGPFDTIMAHIESMSRDIAAMRRFGPNPDATIRWIGDRLRQEAGQMDGPEARAALDRARVAGRQLDTWWREYKGELSTPESRSKALWWGSARAVMTSAKLGSAILSAMGDAGTQMYTRRFNGLPAAKTISDVLALFSPGREADRKAAIRMGLIAEEWAGRTAMMARLTGEELTGEFARRLADATLRLSGLSRWTQAGRWAHGMQMVSALTEAAPLPFAELDDGFAGMLARYGITPDEWDAIRATPLREDRGAEWLMPADIADRDLGDRVLAMIARERDFAVPAVDFRTRVDLNTISPPGTHRGELVRSLFLFKSFGITVLNTHGRRALAQGGAWRAASYMAKLTIATTMMGAVSIQLKEIARGRDPQDMTTPEFWVAAMLQGGGWGIFGDFIKSSENRFGGGLAETIAGPLVQSASNVSDLIIGNSIKAARGDDTDFWHDTLRILRQDVPIASSLWYVRPAWDRIVLGEMDRMINPEHDADVRRMVRNAERDGSSYFWEPGQPLPSRLPDLGRMTGSASFDDSSGEAIDWEAR